jgi:RNase P protein component
VRCEERSAVAFSAARRVKGSVRKNRAKRIVRELYRKNRRGIKTGHHLLCTVREKALRNSYAANEMAFSKLLSRARLLEKDAVSGGGPDKNREMSARHGRRRESVARETAENNDSE